MIKVSRSNKRPIYTLALAAGEAAASWTDLPIHREYVQEQNNRLIATAAEVNLCLYSDNVNRAALGLIRWLSAKHGITCKKARALDVEKAIALVSIIQREQQQAFNGPEKRSRIR
mgnify:CR=1 FL=1